MAADTTPEAVRAGATANTKKIVVSDDLPASALDLLRAACAVAEGALPEREAHPQVFEGLVALLALGAPAAEANALVRLSLGRASSVAEVEAVSRMLPSVLRQVRRP